MLSFSAFRAFRGGLIGSAVMMFLWMESGCLGSPESSEVFALETLEEQLPEQAASPEQRRLDKNPLSATSATEELPPLEEIASFQASSSAEQPPSCGRRNSAVRDILGGDNDSDFDAWRRQRRQRCDHDFEPFPPYDPTPCTSACNLDPHLQEPVGVCQQRCYDLAAIVSNYNDYLREQRELCRARLDGPGARRMYNGELADRLERVSQNPACGPCSAQALLSGRSMVDHLQMVFAQERSGARDVYCVGAGRDRACRSGGEDVSIPMSSPGAAGGYCAPPTRIIPLPPL